MNTEIVALTPEMVDRLLDRAPSSPYMDQARLAYFSAGSVGCCLMRIDTEVRIDDRTGLVYPHLFQTPVFCGGMVNMKWHRAEAWMLPTPFFRKHLKICLRAMKVWLPELAALGSFQRVQATCAAGVSTTLFRHLGFEYEGTCKKFGPNQEDCHMWSRIFGVSQ